MPSAIVTPVATGLGLVRHAPGAAARPAPFIRTIVVFAITALLATSQLYGVIPLVDAIAADWHTAPAAVTWLMTAFGLGYAAGFLLFGPLSDRFGRRRVIVAGVAATAVTTLLVATAPGLGPGVIFRVLQGITMGAFPPAAMAYIGERIEPRRRLVTLTAMTTGFLAAAVFGQLAAQALAAAGWRVFFLAGAATFAVAAAALRWAMLPDGPSSGRSALAPYRVMPALLRSRDLRLLYVAVPTVLTAFVAIYTGLQLTGTTGLLALRASALPVILAIPFLTPRLSRVPGALRVAVALAAGSAGIALVGLLSPGTLGLAALLMVVTAGIAVAAPSLIDTIGTRAGTDRGPAISLFTALMFAGASLGPQIAGALAGHGIAPLALALALLLGTGAVLAAATHRR